MIISNGMLNSKSPPYFKYLHGSGYIIILPNINFKLGIRLAKIVFIYIVLKLKKFKIHNIQRLNRESGLFLL